ncbi:MAG: D-aminoacylase [Bryobacterales bacterium]|nr:D-aminoacylase [Bryobacterales bacterium]
MTLAVLSRQSLVRLNLFVAAVVACTSTLAQEPFDVLIQGGLVVDGSGRDGFVADVGIRGDTLARVGDLSDAVGKRIVDASGHVVAPGFIDIHNHSDFTLLEEPRCESMIRQGVTTMVLGEGGSAGPVRPGEREWTTLGGYFRHVERQGVAANICSYVGLTQVWRYVKGDALEPATESQVREMADLVASAMRDGAMGLSNSLLMPPSNLVTTAQLVQLASVAADNGGIYSTHIRDEGRGVFESVSEAVRVGAEAGIRVDIIHIKIADQTLWGRMGEVLDIIRAGRRRGLDIRANVYPYTAGQNNLRAIIPPWAHDGGNEAMLERLRSPAARERIKRDILDPSQDWYNHYLAVGGDWGRMLLVQMDRPANAPFVGKRMADLIDARGGDPFEVLFEVLLEEGGSVRTVYFHHQESDMLLALKAPFVSVGSDGAAVSPSGPSGASHPHPRWYGTFPRVLGRYVRQIRALELPDAVRKMTAMNAEKLGILDRGLVQEGLRADLVIFDPDTVRDRATFESPHQYPEGIRHVFVNGSAVLVDGEHTGSLPGRVLRGPAN